MQLMSEVLLGLAKSLYLKGGKIEIVTFSLFIIDIFEGKIEQGFQIGPHVILSLLVPTILPENLRRIL